MALVTPWHFQGASAEAGNSASSFDTGMVTSQPLPAPSSSAEPALAELEALRAEVERLQFLVARLRHAINVLQEEEFDPATTPTLLEPLADLRELFPEPAHHLCLAISPLGPAHMPGFCFDHL